LRLQTCVSHKSPWAGIHEGFRYAFSAKFHKNFHCRNELHVLHAHADALFPTTESTSQPRTAESNWAAPPIERTDVEQSPLFFDRV
jgi:hypothetical protein